MILQVLKTSCAPVHFECTEYTGACPQRGPCVKCIRSACCSHNFDDDTSYIVLKGPDVGLPVWTALSNVVILYDLVLMGPDMVLLVCAMGPAMGFLVWTEGGWGGLLPPSLGGLGRGSGSGHTLACENLTFCGPGNTLERENPRFGRSGRRAQAKSGQPLRSRGAGTCLSRCCP